MRPASLEAALGIQGITRAITAPIAKAATVRESSWRREPRRTGPEPYSIVTRKTVGTEFTDSSVVSKITFAGRFPRRARRCAKRHGYRSEPHPDRGRRDPHLGRRRVGVG